MQNFHFFAVSVEKKSVGQFFKKEILPKSCFMTTSTHVYQIYTPHMVGQDIRETPITTSYSLKGSMRNIQSTKTRNTYGISGQIDPFNDEARK